MEENADAMMIFGIVQGQVIIAPMGGVVDIDHKAIHEAMRLYGIRDRRECFRKVLRLAALAREKQGGRK